MLTTPRKLLIAVVLTPVLLLLLIYPHETTTVPEWRITVVDQAGERMRGMAVEETWQDYAFETTSNSEQLISDSEGYVTFPKRTIRASLLGRAGQFLVRLRNVHSSYGSVASIDYKGDYERISKDPIWYQRGHPLASEIVVFRPKLITTTIEK